MTGWLDHRAAALRGRETRGVRRRLRRLDGGVGPEANLEGRTVILAAANDYLALAGSKRLKEAAAEAALSWGGGAGAARLICGDLALHEKLERAIARFKKTEAAIVFSSGYLANLGVLSALARPGDAVFSDQLNHASIVDGCRLSKAEVHVFPHRDVDRLDQLLARSKAGRRVIVSDGLFSMDGHLAPLPDLVEICRRREAILVIDDAHATGVLGPEGLGSLDHFHLPHEGVVQVGTLSKALGALGGFVAGERVLIDYIQNKARSFIFTTALPPAAAAAALAGVEAAQEEPWRRQRVMNHAAWLRAELAVEGLGDFEGVGPIIPVILGPSEAALKASAELLEAGVLVPAVRPPTVPQGAARLRVSLSAGHTQAHLEAIAAALKKTARRRDSRP